MKIAFMGFLFLIPIHLFAQLSDFESGVGFSATKRPRKIKTPSQPDLPQFPAKIEKVKNPASEKLKMVQDKVATIKPLPVQETADQFTRQDAVFRGEGEKFRSCKYSSPVLLQDKKPQSEVTMKSVGFSKSINKDELTFQCVSERRAVQSIPASSLFCDGTTVYFVIDRSGSMADFSEDMSEMFKAMFDGSGLNNSQVNLFVSTSDPTYVGGIDHSLGKLDNALKVLTMTSGEYEEMGFLSALALMQANPPTGSCVHLVFFADEHEQSKPEISLEQFLGKIKTLIGEDRSLYVHSVFPTKCSLYEQAASKTGGIILNSKEESSFQDFVGLVNPAIPRPIMLSTEAESVLSVDVAKTSDGAEGMNYSLTGAGKDWIFSKQKNQVLFDSNQAPTGGDVIHVQYIDNGVEVPRKNRCENFVIPDVIE